MVTLALVVAGCGARTALRGDVAVTGDDPGPGPFAGRWTGTATLTTTLPLDAGSQTATVPIVVTAGMDSGGGATFAFAGGIFTTTCTLSAQRSGSSATFGPQRCVLTMTGGQTVTLDVRSGSATVSGTTITVSLDGAVLVGDAGLGAPSVALRFTGTRVDGGP
jgi:hypothetical protein